jgi:organic radical activating enzyme
MSITLKRPMFRMGGQARSEDTGITSGLRQAYSSGDFVVDESNLDNTNYPVSLTGGNPNLRGIGAMANFYNMFPKTTERPVVNKPLTIEERINELAKSYDITKEDDIASIMSGIGSGFSGAYTLGEALNKSAQARNQAIDARLQKAKEIKTKLALLPLENELQKELEKAKSKESDKQKAADAVRSIYNSRITLIQKQIQLNKDDEDKVIELSKQLQKLQRDRDDSILRINTPGSTKSERIGKLAEALIAKGEATSKNAAAKAKKLYEEIESGEDVSFAKGGSVGNKKMQMQNTETYSEPVTQEENEASVDMPYEAFRARIPSTVPDDIVQLIYYNKSAFTDFANIQAQADVYDFNNKYNVQLVLPMQTQTT